MSAFFIIVLGFVVYSNTLKGGFLWDDYYLVQENQHIKSLANIPKIFTENIGAGALENYHAYRPVQVISFALDYSLWKLNAFGYHLTNIFLHIIAALCLYWLINLLYADNKGMALFASLLFLIHPIHTEAVAYISGRADPLAAVFMLLCFIFYIKGIDKKGLAWILLSMLAYSLAVFSRENSLILPFLILLYHFSFKKKINPGKFLSIAGIAFLYIILRVTVFRTLLTHVDDTSILSERLPGIFVALANYTRLIVFPIGLHMEYGQKLFPWNYPAVWIGAALAVALALAAFKIKKIGNIISFSVFWFFIALIPVSNIYPLNAYMAEHWLYIPSMGIFLLAGKALDNFFKEKQFRIFAIAALTAVAGFYSAAAFKMNSYWADPYRFYLRLINYVNDSERAYNNLGVIFAEKKDYPKALEYFNKAMSVNPEWDEVYFNLGKLHRAVNKDKEALGFYEKALKLTKDPVPPEIYHDIATLYEEFEEYDKAISLFKKAIEINPGYSIAYSSLGYVYHNKGDDEEALKYSAKAIEIDPKNGYAYQNMALIYYLKGMPRDAVKYYDKALNLGVSSPDLTRALEQYR